MIIGEDFSVFDRPRVPLYVQIARYIRKQFVAGKIRRLDRLPPSRQLATHIGVHFNTVLKAYRLLRAEGLVKMYERYRAWIERFKLQWQAEAAKDIAQFEIKAQLRKALSVGVSLSDLQAWLKTVSEEAFEPFRKSPDEILRQLGLKYGS